MPIPAITVPFGPWEPDSADLNGNVLTVARNVYPSKVGYNPFKSASPSALVGGDFGDAALGSCVFADSSNSPFVAAGVGTALKIYSGTSVTTVGTGYTTPDFWRFAKWGDTLIAVSPENDPQVINYVSGSAFAALGGSPPRFQGIFVVGDFLFGTQPDGDESAIHWSDINDSTDWSSGLSDSQTFPDGGEVYGVCGDKSGYVIQRGMIRTFQFLPGDTTTIFEFNRLKFPGAVGPRAWTFAADSVFYYSEEGFCAIGPAVGGFRRIGAHRVDSYVISLGATNFIAVADPYHPRVFFSFVSGGSRTLAIVYDYQLDRWSEVALAVSDMVDSIEGSAGFVSAQMVITTAGILGALTGSNAAATLTTAELELWQAGPMAGQRADITQVRPIVDGAVTSVSVTTKDKLNGSATTTSSTTQETNGRFSLMASGAYHKFSLVTTAANTATYHKGVQVWATPAGEA